MIKRGSNPRTSFHVSPFLNLYYSLEASTGTIIEVYNEEYAEQMKEVLPKRILERFKELHYSQRFSWRVKSCLFDEISEKKLRDSMLLLANDFYQLLSEAFSFYEQYWEEVSPSLISARKVLETNKDQLEDLSDMTSDLLQIPWRCDELHIQLVEPFTGEPIGENVIALGIGPIVSLPATELAAISYMFISHEARHILVGDTIRKIAEKYTTEEHAEYIDEAVMNLIRGSLVKRKPEFQLKLRKAIKAAAELKFPPPSYTRTPSTPEGEIWKARHERRNHYLGYYRELFQSDWEELLETKEPFPKVLEILLLRNREKIKR